MLKTRIITAVFLLTGLLGIVFFTSTQAWALISLVVVWLGVSEWSGLIQLKRSQGYFISGFALALGLSMTFMHKMLFFHYQGQVILAVLLAAGLFWLCIAPIWLITQKVPGKVGMSLLGLLLILAAWLGLVGLHAVSPLLLLAIIAAVSIADSAAYFAGKRFGRHKLAPEISPGKTWEGVLGALAAVSVYGAALSYYLHYSLWLIACLWMLVALSIVGDLVESLLKRRAGLKDSGQLLPGHGGVLDRIDGFMPTLPIALLCTYVFILTGFGAHG